MCNFDHSVAVPTAIPGFGISSGDSLATIVGVLVEVLVMSGLVAIANRTRHWFPEKYNYIKIDR